MSDDLFSQLFNLFNNDDGDVNWQLAEQINNHINKDIQEDRLLSNSDLNYQEIFLYEYHVVYFLMLRLHKM